MQMKYKCCFCGKLYDWYQDVCENAAYDETEARRARAQSKTYGEESGNYISANSIVLKCFLPSPEKSGEGQDVEEASGNLENLLINLCPDCMRELLTKCYPSDTGKRNCFHT